MTEITSAIIDTIGGDPTARASTSSLRNDLNAALARISALENANKVTLNALSLSNTAVQVGTASTITINGTTSGTTITGTPPDGMMLNSSARTISGTATTAGTYTFDLTETGAGASNSPRKSNVTITVAAASSASPFFGSSSQTFGNDTDAVFGKAA